MACPLSPAGHCAARGSRAHHRLDQLADWPRSAVRFPIKCSNHELSYALLARARESFELCSHFKSLPPVSDRELSADLTWRARRRKPEFPALGSETQSRCVLGERGVKGIVLPGQARDDCRETLHQKRCVFRRSDPTRGLNHLVNGEPRIAALPSETGIIINPQTMSEEDETVPAKHAFLGAIWPRKLNDLFAKTGSGQTYYRT